MDLVHPQSTQTCFFWERTACVPRTRQMGGSLDFGEAGWTWMGIRYFWFPVPQFLRRWWIRKTWWLTLVNLGNKKGVVATHSGSKLHLRPSSSTWKRTADGFATQCSTLYCTRYTKTPPKINQANKNRPVQNSVQHFLNILNLRLNWLSHLTKIHKLTKKLYTF